MKIKDLMTEIPRVVSPTSSVRFAAEVMRDADVGALPVVKNGKCIGIITDRDITIRVTAKGGDPDSKILEAMTTDVSYCRDDDDVDDAAKLIRKTVVRRIPVLDGDDAVVGMISLADLVRSQVADLRTPA